ncbi:MAG: DUF433 domain-containing protein [Tepidisphaeraceae bacterium]|jgi:uncharacterized protein (DUF433 family)
MEDRIIIDPAICHGKPVIRGTRMPVALIIGSLAGGMSFDEVQQEYDLTTEDIRAALRFAGELIDREQFHPLPT